MNVHQIKRIFEDPSHPSYGPVRRLWMILEQLLADCGGMAAWETRLRLYSQTLGINEIRWEEHFIRLMHGGLSEADAMRTVVTQVLTAREMLS